MLGLLAMTVMAFAPPAAAIETSELAIPKLHGAAEVPELWLAQRTIEREWGLSEDSTYNTVDVKGWKTEGLALSLSGILPGAGHLYVGENSGWAYVVGEALGWYGRWQAKRRGDEAQKLAAEAVGNPLNPDALWSFERYAANTGDNADQLRTLWEKDREAFYELLSSDTRYSAGFLDTEHGFNNFHDTHEFGQKRLRQARYLEIALWANHVVAAFDALRAARLHNMPLRRNLDLQLGGRLHSGKPRLRAAVVRRF